MPDFWVRKGWHMCMQSQVNHDCATGYSNKTKRDLCIPILNLGGFPVPSNEHQAQEHSVGLDVTLWGWILNFSSSQMLVKLTSISVTQDLKITPELDVYYYVYYS